jgi:hypothetical protein
LRLRLALRGRRPTTNPVVAVAAQVRVGVVAVLAAVAVRLKQLVPNEPQKEGPEFDSGPSFCGQNNNIAGMILSNRLGKWNLWLEFSQVGILPAGRGSF